MYHVNYLNSRDDDLVYDDIQTAYTEAIGLTEVDPEAAFGVWQDEVSVSSIRTDAVKEMAISRCAFWTPGSPYKSKSKYFITLKESEGGWYDQEGPYEAFRRSAHNIMEAWRNRQARQRQQVGQQYALTWSDG